MLRIWIILFLIILNEQNIKLNLNENEFGLIQNILIKELKKKIKFPVKLDNEESFEKSYFFNLIKIKGIIKDFQIKNINLDTLNIELIDKNDDEINIKINVKEIDIELNHSFYALFLNLNGSLSIKTDIFLNLNILQRDSNIIYHISNYDFNNFKVNFSNLFLKFLYMILNFLNFLQNKCINYLISFINDLFSKTPLKNVIINIDDFKFNISLEKIRYEKYIIYNYINLGVDIKMINEKNKFVQIENNLKLPTNLNYYNNLLVDNKILSYLIYCISQKINLNVNNLIKNKKIDGKLLSLVFPDFKNVSKDLNEEVLINIKVNPVLNKIQETNDTIIFENFWYLKDNEIFLKNEINLKLYSKSNEYCNLKINNMINILIFFESNNFHYKNPYIYINKIINENCKIKFNEEQLKNVIMNFSKDINRIEGQIDLIKNLKNYYIDKINIQLIENNLNLIFKL